MSADNYFVVRPHPGGGFTPIMGFASDDRDRAPQMTDPSFATPEEALSAVLNEYAEYGHSISPECYPDRDERSPWEDDLGEDDPTFLLDEAPSVAPDPIRE